jgi:hypothetical protein
VRSSTSCRERVEVFIESIVMLLLEPGSGWPSV